MGASEMFLFDFESRLTSNENPKRAFPFAVVYEAYKGDTVRGQHYDCVKKIVEKEVDFFSAIDKACEWATENLDKKSWHLRGKYHRRVGTYKFFFKEKSDMLLFLLSVSR